MKRGPKPLPVDERERRLADRLARQYEEQRKPQAARPVFRRPRHQQWFSRCPAFRPLLDIDSNRSTKL